MREDLTMTQARALTAGFGGGLLVGRVLTRERMQFVGLAGSSIAGPSAAGWVTDFLNAAYYRRAWEERKLDDLRVAWAIIATFWLSTGGRRRLRASDALAFHRAFGRERFLKRAGSPRGVLTREQLLWGARRLLGDWFPAAYADDARRAWGIAFPTIGACESYEPEQRMRLARLGALTPEIAPATEQTWHTYPPVQVGYPEAVMSALTHTETWPDYATETGRFTALRRSPLAGQTFEIDVAAGTAAGRPVFQRGYVTITRLVTPEDPDAVKAYFSELEDGLARFGRDEPRAVPEGGEPLVGFDLTTHEGHFMGRGHNRLILYRYDDRTWVRAAGTWDPMPWHLEQAYRRAGRDAQHAFWGQGAIQSQSMLHQIALATAT